MEEYFYNEGHRLMQNDFIRQNQARLNIIREERSEPWHRLETDGIFGLITRDVVKEFQKKYCQPSNGRLDERTQKEILNVTNQCVIQKERSTIRKSKPKVDLTVNSKQYNFYANPSVVCPMTACAKVTPVASPPPVASSVAPDTYENDEVTFTEWVKNQWSSIASDLRSVLSRLPKVSIPKIPGYLIQELKVLFPKIVDFVKKAISMGFYNLAKASSEKLKSIFEMVKTKGQGYVKVIKKDPQYATRFKSNISVKTFAKGNVVGIVLAAAPMIINLFKWIACDDSESAKCREEFWASFRSFVGALIILAGIQLAAGALAAAGVAGGSVVLVAAIIGIAVAIIDILVMAIRDDGKGLGDLLGELINFVYEGLTEAGKSLGDWFFEVTHPDVPKSYTVYELELMGLGPDGLPMVSGHAR